MKARLVLKSLSEITVEDISSGAINQPPPKHPTEPSQAMELSEADLEAVREESARFSKDLLRRQEEPFPAFWVHGGLNE
jgi:hypothetical protein